MIIPREIQSSIASKAPPRAVVLLGGRRVGKTTLLEEIAARDNVSFYNGDNPEDIERLQMRSAGDVASVLSQGDTIVIDEAQRFPDIGLTLKRLVHANEKAQKQVRIFATGRSTSVFPKKQTVSIDKEFAPCHNARLSTQVKACVRVCPAPGQGLAPGTAHIPLI